MGGQPSVSERTLGARVRVVATTRMDRVQRRPLGVEPCRHRHDDHATTWSDGTIPDMLHQRHEEGGAGARHEGRLAVPMLGAVPPDGRKTSGRHPGRELDGCPRKMGLDPPQHRQGADGDDVAPHISDCRRRVHQHSRRPGRQGWEGDRALRAVLEKRGPRLRARAMAMRMHSRKSGATPSRATPSTCAWDGAALRAIRPSACSRRSGSRSSRRATTAATRTRPRVCSPSCPRARWTVRGGAAIAPDQKGIQMMWTGDDDAPAAALFHTAPVLVTMMRLTRRGFMPQIHSLFTARATTTDGYRHVPPPPHTHTLLSCFRLLQMRRASRA